MLTDEVDDEAAVGASPRGVPEVRHAVRQLRRGEVVRDAIHDEVAGVHEGVPEVEDGRVLLRRRQLPASEQHDEDEEDAER